MNKEKIAYYITTGLLSALMLMSAGMYVFNHAEVAKVFTTLGYPTYIMYPLAAAKVLGVIAIWTKLSDTLLEWAYAGFFFDFVLAAAAHIAVKDGQYAVPIIATLLLLASYILHKRLERAESEQPST